jgi:hypothetical protein
MRAKGRVELLSRLKGIEVVEKGRKMRGKTGNHGQKGVLGGLTI